MIDPSQLGQPQQTLQQQGGVDSNQLGQFLAQQSSQQAPQQGGLNFGQLSPIKPGAGVVAQAGPTPQAASTDGDSGLGSLAGLVSKMKDSLFGTSSQSSAQNDPGGTVQKDVSNQLGMTGQQNSNQSTLAAVAQNSGIFDNAMKELGLKSTDPTLQNYLAKANPGLDPTQTPWCAGFVGSVLNASGTKGTGSLAAKSYLNYGTPTQTPSNGDIVVFNDLTGKNDPAHGHVGFVQSIDPQNGLVRTLGGNQDGSVSMKEYPLSSVAGFRKPPTGQQVQQFSQQNGIQNPAQLSNFPNTINNPQSGQVSPQTLNTIKNFEDFTPKASWDVNAYRAGYGSDTTTLADGSVHKIQPGMQVSQEDADRDLSRRTAQFQQTAASQAGTSWSKLTPGAQTALTSIAYNYGSLPRRILPAVQSGDPNQIAAAIKSLASDNGGINRDRRNKEATMVVTPQHETNMGYGSQLPPGSTPPPIRTQNTNQLSTLFNQDQIQSTGLRNFANPKDIYSAGTASKDDIKSGGLDMEVRAFKNTPTVASLVQEVGSRNLTNPVDIAKAYVGLNNFDPKANDTIAAVIRKGAGNEVDPKNTGYCGLFVDSILRTSGRAGLADNDSHTNELYGTKVLNPSKGDIVNMNGHIAFYVGRSAGKPGYIDVLGGNQSTDTWSLGSSKNSNQLGVNILSIPEKEVNNYRHPPQGDKLKSAALTLHDIVAGGQ